MTTVIPAIGLAEFGGPEVLHVVELPQTQPGPGQVRISVSAAAVNPTDATFRSGGRAAQLSSQQPPYIPGMDLAGTIDAIDEGVDDRLHVGDFVVALVLPFAETKGAYTTSIVVDRLSVVRAPDDATPAEASTLLLNAVTATLALDALALEAGDLLAVTGASGAVGTYAIELAKHRGLVVAADARVGQEDTIRQRGADTVLARGAGFAAGLRAVYPSGARGLVDAATLGGAALPAIAGGGAIASLKGWTGPTERDIRVEAISSFGSVTDTALLESTRDLASDGVFHLRVAETLAATDAAEAHRRLARGGLDGRLVLDLTTLR